MVTQLHPTHVSSQNKVRLEAAVLYENGGNKPQPGHNYDADGNTKQRTPLQCNTKALSLCVLENYLLICHWLADKMETCGAHTRQSIGQ